MRHPSTIAAALCLMAACGAPPECLNVPSSALDYLNGVLEDDGVRVTRAAAVRSSDDYRGVPVYFIAGEIDGEGYEGTGDVGVWGQPGRLGPTAMNPVAGDLASRVSTFGTASEATFRSPSWPGIGDARACLEQLP